MASASPELAPGALPPATTKLLAGAGFDVAASIPIDAYDRLVPEAWQGRQLAGPRAVRAIVLGTGGGGFERAWRTAATGRRTAEDPIDTFTRETLAAACRSIEAETGERAVARIYADRERAGRGEPVFADFVALAEAAGLGARGRVGLLLHPEYGPWWAVRGLIVTSLSVPGASVATDPSRSHTESPCVGCAAPCVAACPGGAVGPVGFDAARCADTRLALDDCAARCDARRACVVATDHAYAPADEAVYAAASLAWVRRAASGAGDESESPFPGGSRSAAKNG